MNNKNENLEKELQKNGELQNASVGQMKENENYQKDLNDEFPVNYFGESALKNYF